MSDSWRYIATRLNGNGTETPLHWELPLSGVKIEDRLSGPTMLQAQVNPEINALAGDGLPMFRPWSTALYAEKDGAIRAGTIVSDVGVAEDGLSITATGFTSYAGGMPYMGDWARIQVDPLDCVREIWRHIQSYQGGNLGLSVDTDRTQVRLGTPRVPEYTEVQLDGKWVPKSSVQASRILPEVKAVLAKKMTKASTSFEVKSLGKFSTVPTPFEVNIQGERIRVGSRSGVVFSNLTRGVNTTIRDHGAGAHVVRRATPTRIVPEKPAEPYRLSWYETPNLGSEFEELARDTPFDYREEHYWSGDTIRHRLSFGHPRLGARRSNLRFVLGENVIKAPELEYAGVDYASDVLFIGAGQGSAQLKWHVATPPSRLRRFAVVQNKAIASKTRLLAAARSELAWRNGTEEVEQLLVREHPHARLGSWQVGDEIFIQVGSAWRQVSDLWVRVLSMQYEPERPNHIILNVTRADRIE